MGSDPLDPNQFIREHLGDSDAAGAVIGHVHLRVGGYGAGQGLLQRGVGL